MNRAVTFTIEELHRWLKYLLRSRPRGFKTFEMLALAHDYLQGSERDAYDITVTEVKARYVDQIVRVV